MENSSSSKSITIAQGGLIAALYVVLTFICSALGLSSGAIQVRFSEALTILPYFTPAAIPGLFVGCFLSNLLTGCAIWDVILGSIATLIGAFFTRKLRKLSPWLAPIPPIVSNMIIVPMVLKFVYEIPMAIPFMVLTVGIGEIISCGVLGMILLFFLKKRMQAIL